MGTEYVIQIEVLGVDYHYPMKIGDGIKHVTKAHGNLTIRDEHFEFEAYPNQNRLVLDKEPDNNVYRITNLRIKLKAAVMSIIGQIKMPYIRRVSVK